MFNLNQFNFHKQTRTLTADASDLQDDFGNYITIKSEHSGKVIVFKRFATERDEVEGETLGWIYKPETKLPNVEKLMIFND